jgi:hypothetical protein
VNIFVGIDPGKTGGAAFIGEDMSIYALVECPIQDYELVANFAATKNEISNAYEHISWIYALEDIVGWPGESRLTNKTFVFNMGVWAGACYGMDFDPNRDAIFFPAPRSWQAIYRHTPEWSKYKKSGLNRRLSMKEKRHRVYGTVCAVFGYQIDEKKKLLLGPKGGIKDGLCDALLIANWARLFWRAHMKNINK